MRPPEGALPRHGVTPVKDESWPCSGDALPASPLYPPGPCLSAPAWQVSFVFYREEERNLVHQLCNTRGSNAEYHLPPPDLRYSEGAEDGRICCYGPAWPADELKNSPLAPGPAETGNHLQVRYNHVWPHILCAGVGVCTYAILGGIKQRGCVCG